MRDRFTAADESSGIPNRSFAVAEGKPSNARPAPASTIAVTVCNVFMVIRINGVTQLAKTMAPHKFGATA